MSEKIALAIMIVLIYLVWLIKFPFYLLIRIFVCSWKGHELRFYGGGFFNPLPDLPLIPITGVICNRCNKKERA